MPVGLRVAQWYSVLRMARHLIGVALVGLLPQAVVMAAVFATGTKPPWELWLQVSLPVLTVLIWSLVRCEYQRLKDRERGYEATDIKTKSAHPFPSASE